ncbi:MAG: HD family hydrolase [Hyphomicrobiales bacterium]|nr:HD family hydrolase [Hyphomicrobiales bacterium]
MRAANLRPRAWQRMLSGRRLDLIEPAALDVEIVDIAHGLARVARWNGQTHGAHIFSVAQHSLLVEAIFSAGEPRADAAGQMAALLHDAPEYVIGDMISPFKAVIGDAYRRIEEGLLSAIHLRFGLANPSPPALKAKIKRADRAAAHHEAVRLAGFAAAEANKFFGAPVTLTPQADALLALQPVEVAQARFLARYHELDHALTAGTSQHG